MSLSDLFSVVTPKRVAHLEPSGFHAQTSEYLRKKLPVDVFGLLFDFLDVTDALRLSESSTAMYRLCRIEDFWVKRAEELGIDLCEGHHEGSIASQPAIASGNQGATHDAAGVETLPDSFSALECIQHALTAPRAFQDGQYIATQKLARSAGFGRSVFTSVAVGTAVPLDPTAAPRTPGGSIDANALDTVDHARSTTAVLPVMVVCGLSTGMVRWYRVCDSTPETQSRGDAVERPTITLQPEGACDHVHASIVTAVCLTTLKAADGSQHSYIVSGGADGNVFLTDLTQTGLASTLLLPAVATDGGDAETSHSVPICCVAMHPSLPVLLSADELGTVKMWNLSSCSLICEFSAHFKSVASMVWLPDSHKFVTGSFDGTCVLWECGHLFKNAVPLTSVSTPPVKMHTLLHSSSGAYRVYDVAATSTGSLIAAACGDGSVRVFETVKPTKAGVTLPASTLWTKTVAFTCGDRGLLAAGGDFRVRSWNVSGMLHASLQAARMPAFGDRPMQSVKLFAYRGTPSELERGPSASTKRTSATSLTLHGSPSPFGGSPHSALAAATAPSLRKVASRNSASALAAFQGTACKPSVAQQDVFNGHQCNGVSYLGTLDAHAGAVTQVRTWGPYTVTISMDESLVIRRYVPTHLLHDSSSSRPAMLQLLRAEESQASDSEVDFFICDEAMDPHCIVLEAPTIVRPAPISLASSSCTQSSVGVLSKPLLSSLSSSRPSFGSLRVLTPRVVAPQSLTRRLQLPMHPQMPFTLEAAGSDRWYGRESAVTRTPSTPVRKSASAASAWQSGALRMAGGPGAVAILPAKLKRISWPQGSSLVEHISSLLSAAP